VQISRMRYRRPLPKRGLKISRLPDSYEVTTGNMVDVWLGHGLTTTLGGAPRRVLQREGIPNASGCPNSAPSAILQAQAARESSRSYRDQSQLESKVKRCEAF
jgi:hypothetical protein